MYIVIINYENIKNDMIKANDRIVENQYFKELFEPLQKIYREEYDEICRKLDEERHLKKEVDIFAVEIDYIYNMSLELYNVKEIDYLNAKKEIAKICLESKIQPGEYFGKDANRVVRTMQKRLIEYFENKIQGYDRLDIHKKLVELQNIIRCTAKYRVF